MEKIKEEKDQSKKRRSTKERRGGNEHRKSPLEGKANETGSGPIEMEENFTTGENKDPEKSRLIRSI